MSHPNGIQPLAKDFVTLYQAPHFDIHCYSPGIVRCPNGRLIATIDLAGPDAPEIKEPSPRHPISNWKIQGQVFLSDDQGKTWRFVTSYPMYHARPFVSGNSLYILGHNRDLAIIRSDDWGESWSESAYLTQGQWWHQAPCNVHYANDCVYLVMERRVSQDVWGWYICELAPILMRGKIGTDLLQRKNWTFASEITIPETIPDGKYATGLDFFGVPFFNSPWPKGAYQSEGRHCAPIGWLESNVVEFTDPNHYWHDPAGHTFHLWMRAHTGGTGYAMLLKVHENQDGSMTTLMETAPSGKKMLYVPCPGGQMKFHVLYDEDTQLFWLLSSQATDSMTRAELLPDTRYSLPNNERHRLQLHFSKNMIDWCFAGLIAAQKSPLESRNYASMIIDGNDLRILSRSGNSQAKSAHDGNMITFHTVENFRDLVY